MATVVCIIWLLQWEDGAANALAEAETTGIVFIDKAPRKGAEGLQIALYRSQINFGAS